MSMQKAVKKPYAVRSPRVSSQKDVEMAFWLALDSD
jgi:hypothetical protein